MQNSKIITKIALPFCLILGISVGLVAYARSTMHEMAAQTATIADVNGGRIDALMHMRGGITEAVVMDRNGLLERNAERKATFRARQQVAMAEARAAIEKLISLADYEFLISQVLMVIPGDANLDGLFNSSDLVVAFQQAQYEDQIPNNSGWASGDWNCDGDFTTSDLVVAFQSGSYVAASQSKATESDTPWRRPVIEGRITDAAFLDAFA